MEQPWNKDLDRLLDIVRGMVVRDNFGYLTEGKMDYECFSPDQVQYEQQGPL